MLENQTFLQIPNKITKTYMEKGNMNGRSGIDHIFCF